MRSRLPIPPSRTFNRIAGDTRFRDRIAVIVNATPDAIFKAVREVTVRDMKLAWLLGEIRYLPTRIAGHMPPADSRRPFLTSLIESGTLILHDDAPHELITGSAAQLHRINQHPLRFSTRQAFEVFADPDHEKLFMSIRVAPTGVPGEQWLVLEHATRALSSVVERRFARYWVVIKPMGAFVTWQLLRAVRRRAEGCERIWRSVGASREERTRRLPGDERIPEVIDTLTHGVTIRRAPRDVWPWLVQMGAGSRAGWYSYDWIDNGRQPSANRIVPELQHPAVGTIFPALPGVMEGFNLLIIEPERVLTLGWASPDGTPQVTWTFHLEEQARGVTRLLVRARAGPAYRFHGLPPALTRLVARAVHFVMQRRQLLGIKRRAEAMPAGTISPNKHSGTAKDAA
jgi:hypothetical protein